MEVNDKYVFWYDSVLINVNVPEYICGCHTCCYILLVLLEFFSDGWSYQTDNIDFCLSPTNFPISVQQMMPDTVV